MKSKKQIKYSYNRILEISDDAKQITLPDSRYYQRNGDFYPSITYVLGAYPKGKHFEEWLMKHGFSSRVIAKQSADEGTATHELCEDYLNGKEVSFLDKNDIPKYPEIVWNMFLRFVEFWEAYKPKLIDVEVHLFSDKHKIAGTCDLVCEINDELWIIDFKTSNHIHRSMHLQTSAYSQCYEEDFGKKPVKRGILWLKSSKRKLNIEKMSGKGWELIQSPNTFEEDFDIYLTVKKIFDLENPNHKPYNNNFPITVKREL